MPGFVLMRVAPMTASAPSLPCPGDDANGIVAVLTTVDTQARAQAIARTLVEQGLAACVHIVEIQSVYVWQDALHQGAEWQLSCKTTAAREPALRQALLALHPYELPALHSERLHDVHPPFAQWVIEMTGAHAP